MAGELADVTGGIAGLCELLTGEHGEAVRADLADRGYLRADFGYAIGWGDVGVIVRWLGRESAYFRSRHPNSWWYTPEVAVAERIQYVLECANWQRSGGQGEKPRPPKPPTDQKPTIGSRDELEARRKHQREHLAKRRAQIAARKRG